MAKTYSQMMEEIEALKGEAETVRQQEVEGVIARIKEAIAFYGLTPEDLGFQRGAGRPAKARGVGKAQRKPAARGAGAQAKYRDEHGNTWSGRGPRPKWFKDALAAGRQPDEFSARPS